MIYRYDYLVIGSGIAGMSFALKASSHGRRVAVICKSTLEDANTYFAQGGVASVTNLLVDDFDKHIHDTMVAGDWLSDPAAVEQVVKNAPEQIRQLVAWGVDFDKKEDGTFDMRTNTEVITAYMKKHGLILNNTYQDFPGLCTMYPSEHFCPKDHGTGSIIITDKSVCIHHFAGSWIDKSWWDETKHNLKCKFVKVVGPKFGSLISDIITGRIFKGSRTY